MKLKDDQAERLRTLTVEFLLDLYRQALQNGWNPLDLWDQISNRMRAAARTSASPDEWTSAMLRSLKLSAPSKDSSRSLIDLSNTVREWGCAVAWLNIVDREFGYIIALTKSLNEDRKAARLAAMNPTPVTEETPHV